MFGLGMLISISAFLDFLRFLVMKNSEFQSILAEIFRDEKRIESNLCGDSKTRYKETSIWISKLILFYKISVTFSVFTVFCLSSFVILEYLNDAEKEEHDMVYKKYILGIAYLPFNTFEHYVLSHVVINLFVYFSSFMVCLVDVAFLMPIWYITMKLEVLGVEIRKISKYYNEDDWNIDASEHIVKFIKEHISIIQ